jgi:hypothetical protein
MALSRYQCATPRNQNSDGKHACSMRVIAVVSAARMVRMIGGRT